jgi:hypothetical protein
MVHSGEIVLVPVDGRGSFCVGCRRINPDWPQASALTRDLEQAINGTKYQEPTQEMVSPVPLLLWQSRAQSRCRCGREPSPVADVGLTMQRSFRGVHSQVLGAVLGLNANIQKTSVGFTGFVCLLRCGITRHVSIAHFAAFAHSLVCSVRSKQR